MVEYDVKIQIVHSKTETIKVEGDEDLTSLTTFSAIRKAIDDVEKKEKASWVNILEIKNAG